MRGRAADEGLEKKQSRRPAAVSERSRGPLRDSAEADALSPASMLGLQHSIGNTALNRALAQAPAGQSVQRAPSGSGSHVAAAAPATVSVEQLRALVESAYIRNHVPELKNWATGADDALPYRAMTTDGQLWHDLDRHDGPRATQASGRAYVAAKSQADVTDMGHELAGHGDADGWQSAVRHKLESAVRASVLRHYTIDTRVEQMLNGGDTGAMKSKMKLDQDTANAAHNTGDFDLHDLANHGFVFFYIEPKGAPFRPSRFSEGGKPVRITLPIAQVVQNGWIMLNDFLDMEVPTLRSDAKGNLLSYRRDEGKANSPEAKMWEAHANRAQAIRQAWQDNPDLNQRAAQLAAMLSRSFATRGAEAVGPKQTKAITDLLSTRSQIEQHIKANGMDKDLTELKEQFAKSVQFNVQARRFEPAPGSLGGETRYMAGHPNAESSAMKALPNAIKRYREQVHGNILAGPHIISGLAQRGVLEIARIEAQGGHGALVSRMKAMSGDELLRMLLKDFIRPQAMVPWAVRISRGDVEAMP
ncbi:hypothetical protein ABH935_007705 [Catenulispora sp. GAS73]|uniref:hypothetical protein n=1 Tax=Catenulispora sp. GAS73 TaxID=3156269 RepID=UPI0035164285